MEIITNNFEIIICRSELLRILQDLEYLDSLLFGEDSSHSRKVRPDPQTVILGIMAKMDSVISQATEASY